MNEEEDVYLKDLRTGELSVVTARGGRARGGRYSALSGNGRWVAFVSDELVRRDRNGDWDVYVRNVATGRVELVSLLNGGRQTRAAFDDVDVSYDGSRVGYAGGGAVHVYDRGTGRRVRADVDNRGKAAAHPFVFGNFSLSADGRAVAFASTAALSRADENGRPDVYVRDLRARTTELVSGAPEGELESWSVSISRRGRFVAFGSDAGGRFDVYVHDRAGDTALRATSDCAGASGHPSLSNDGRWVAFASEDCGGAGMLFARGPLR